MPWCERCELDDSMCAHSPAALRVAERERRRARPTQSQRDIRGYGPTSSNREWSGEPVSATDYLREPRHAKDAGWQVDATYNAFGCICKDCERTGRCFLDEAAPEVDDLEEYSHVALGFSASLVFHDDVQHDQRPHLREWVRTLRERHVIARAHAADLADTDFMLAARGKSAKPPQRWLGRSPGYYSRGR